MTGAVEMEAVMEVGMVVEAKAAEVGTEAAVIKALKGKTRDTALQLHAMSLMLLSAQTPRVPPGICRR